MANDELQPDPPLNEYQQSIVGALSSDFVKEVDRVLLSYITKNGRKVAMVVGLAMMNDNIRILGLPDMYYAQRIKKMVRDGVVVAEGNLDFMRYSEVRLP